MSLQDFRGQGPPGDIGTFTLPVSGIVYQSIFSGTTYIVAARQGDRGWVLVGYSTVAATVINNALTACISVSLMEGNYSLSVTILMDVNRSLKGVNRDTVILTKAFNGSAITNLGGAGSGNNNLKLENFTLNCVKASWTGHGIDIQKSTDIQIDNLHVYNAQDIGIYGTGVGIARWRISHCEVNGCTTRGISIASGSDYNIVHNNYMHDNTGDGIAFFSGSESNVVADNIINSNGGYGVYFYQVNKSTVVGNTFYHNTNHGVYLTGSAGTPSIYNTVSGNTFDDMVTDGINLIHADYNTVIGNVAYSCRDGISLENADWNIISSNSSHGNSEQGVDAGISDYNVIIGNNCKGNLSGIKLDSGSDYNIVSGNRCQGNTGNGIDLFWEVTDQYGNTLVGNSCIDNGSNGISLNRAHNTIIEGNTCTGNDSANTGTYSGIWLYNSDDNLIKGNICRDNDKYGIDINNAGCDTNVVKDNRFANNTAGPFNDAGTGTILPTLILPFVDGTLSVTADAAPKGWSITLATNFALALGVMPPDCQQSVRIKVHAISLAAEADGMRLQVTADACQPDEAWNAEDINITKTSTTLNFAANDGIIWTLTPADDADVGHLIAGDQIEIKAIYAAVAGADIATNALLRCVEIQYV